MRPTYSYQSPPPIKQDRFHLQWRVYARTRVHIPEYDEESSSQPSAHAYKFACRIHAWVVRVLEQEMQFPSTQTEGRLPSGSLQEFLHWAMEQHQPLSSMSPQVQRQLRLQPTSHKTVISLAQDMFLEDFQHFEVGTNRTTEYFQKHSLGAYLYHVPYDALRVISCALVLAVATVAEKLQTDIEPEIIHHYLALSQLSLSFRHVQPKSTLRDALKTGLVGKLVAVTGHVVQVRPAQLRVATADYQCNACRCTVTAVPWERGQYRLPTKCTKSGCKSRSFTLQRSSAVYRQVQIVRLQEASDECLQQAGRTPRQVLVELSAEAATCRPGDTVQLAAVVAAKGADEGKSKMGGGRWGKKSEAASTTFELYMQGHSVSTLSERSGGEDRSQQEQQQQQHHYTQAQLSAITQLCHADHRYFSLTERRAFSFDLLVRSLCPSILGHDLVKAGMVLCLLGGTPSENGSGISSSADSTTIRSNSHLLVVGDPGMGKVCCPVQSLGVMAF